MSTYETIQKRVSKCHERHPADIAKFGDTVTTDSFGKLKDYVEYLELYNLKDTLPESWFNAKRKLKKIALENNTLDTADKEEAFYDLLKICVNPQKEINYDFYFEKHRINKEDEVEEILFDKDKGGQLRGIFLMKEGDSQDWQIRLRTIADWFLKRYDFKNAKKILKNIDSKHKTVFDRIKLFSPRLWGAISIGFLPLIVGQETWELPLKLGWNLVSGLSILFLLIIFWYLRIECFNVTRDKTTVQKRAMSVCLRGFGISLIFSTFIVYVMGEYSVITSDLKKKAFDFFGTPLYLENIIFFTSAALLIGIFIQVFWEEKTITEPL